MTVQTRPFDAITIDSLRESGGLKWSMFPDKIGAFVAEMDFGTADPITAALHEAVDSQVFGYLPKELSGNMSEAASNWLASRYGWSVRPERVRPLADVISGLQVAIEFFSAPGSAIILPTPAYMPFVSVPPAMGRDVIEVPMVVENGRYSYDLDALDAAFAAGGNLLILCNPHNPVGRVLSRTELDAIATVVHRHGGRVFSDEIHAPLVLPGAEHVPYAAISDIAAGHTVTAMSASKAWNLPGMKCAQMVLSNEADAVKWEEVGLLPEHGAANLGVVANIAAYNAGGRWLNNVLGYLDNNRRLLRASLAEHLPQVGYTPPEGTYLAWLDCRSLGLGDSPAEFFAERAGVAMTDGARCGDAGKGFARFNFATPAPIIDLAVRQMADALR